MVVVDEDRKTLQVVVANDQLSLAIGRGGQNVRLASELLGWRIDVKSEEKYAKMMEDGFQSLVAIDGINNKIADILYENDIGSAAELAEAVPADIAAIFTDLDLETAEKMVEAAGLAILKSGEEKSVGDSPEAAPGAAEVAASADDSAQPEVETK